MVAALRAAKSTAAAAAALVASSGPLDVNKNGTYSATVLLGSRRVTLGVDMQRFGIWVSCRVFEADECDVGVSGYPEYPYTSLEYGTRRFAEVTIAGQVLKDLDVYVAYDPLRLSDPSFQGYLGLDSETLPEDIPAFGQNANVTTIALQLGATSADSSLSLNTINRTLLEARQLTTKTTVDPRVSCFRLPVARSNTTVDDCTFTPGSSNYQVRFDSASEIIEMEYQTMRKFEDRFLSGCSKVYKDSYYYSYSTDWYGYTCNATTKLPRLMFQMGAWEFYLDPVDYTTPANATFAGTPQVKVLFGGSTTSSSWELGTPFLRKFPIMFNATERFATQYYNLFCKENTTCRNVPVRPISSGYTGGGGGGGGGDYELDIGTKRKRNKLYLSIGLGVGGVVFLGICGCICKCCRDSTTEEGEGDNDAKAAVSEDVAVEVTIALTAGIADSSDASDDDTEAKSKPKSKEADVSKAATMAKSREKQRSAPDDSSSSDSDGSSSDYDSESSEERRRERRRRRRRRRDRRRARKEKEEAAQLETVTDETEAQSQTPYVATTTPRAAQRSS